MAKKKETLPVVVSAKPKKKRKSTAKNPEDRQKAGRKKSELDWKLITQMLRAGCEGTAIATHIGISNDTLYRHIKERYSADFAVVADYRRKEGKEMLRLKQFELALKGDRTMLIWLGKNYLDQKDRNEFQVTTEEAKDNFMILLPDDGRSSRALNPPVQEAIVIPDDEAELQSPTPPPGLFKDEEDLPS